MSSTTDDDYAGQKRGDASAYERYLAGMDASMRQKVALTAAHLLSQGLVADMGMGSGTGSQALASLYPDLAVVGVDINQEMVDLATDRYKLPNLRFIQGDIAEPCFDGGTLDAILDSSVLHHVTSFTGYSTQAAVDALAVQVQQLAPGGILIVRDFVRPAGEDAAVILELPTSNGTGDVPGSCSTATLFERFAVEFRSLSPTPGFAFTELSPATDGWRRFKLTRRHAVEFVLRKDYTRDWGLEAKEEYTYLAQEAFERVFAELGLRVLASTPIFNPWIVGHRFVGQFRWREASGDGRLLDWPATNYVIVGQRVSQRLGVRFEQGQARDPGGYLHMEHWRRDDGQVFDLTRRPGQTIDVVPWFVAPQTGAVHVLARRSYPRPVMAVEAAATTIDGSRAPHYVTEPLAFIVGDKPIAQTVEKRLGEFPDLQSDDLVEFTPGTVYYPSPGGLQEQVRSLFVKVKPTNLQASMAPVEPWSGWGSVRAIEARQLLRAAQVGGLPDARLELNVYDLLLKLGRGPGPWIGEVLTVPPCDGSQVQATPLAEVRGAAAPRRRFRRAQRPPHDPSRFLDLRRAVFIERGADGGVLGQGELEYVVPRPLSAQTVSVALLVRGAGGEVLCGIDDDDLPAAQCFTGHSQLLVVPAWRLPRGVATWRGMQAFIGERLRAEYGVETAPLGTLGGRYHPSPGCTPEVVYPLVTTVVSQAPDGPARRPLRWVPLTELVDRRADLADGHLRVATTRAAHALGLLDKVEG